MLKARMLPCPTEEERLLHQQALEDLQAISREVLSEDRTRLLIESVYEASAYIIILVKRNEEDCPGIRQRIELDLYAKVLADGMEALHEQLLKGIEDGVEDS